MIERMSRTVYLNGAFVREEDARISVFDRGLLFADGVYEVVAALDGKLVDFPAHMERLADSLAALEIAGAPSAEEILEAHREVVARNELREGLVYTQVTRGSADRDFLYENGLAPNVFLFTQAKDIAANPVAARGAKVKSVLDLRWARRDIKSISLLAQVMAKREAQVAGADEALLVTEDGMVNEGGSSSAHIVRRGGIVTRPLSRDILAGVTRAALMALAREEGMGLEERAFSLREAMEAEECFLTAASLPVCPVVEIDGRAVGGGAPGPLAQRLRGLYLEHARATGM